MPSHRIQRVRELLKREIGNVIRREIPAEEAGLVSVNDVDVAGDLRSALVFIASWDWINRSAASRCLKNRGRIQHPVALGGLKYFPH